MYRMRPAHFAGLSPSQRVAASLRGLGASNAGIEVRDVAGGSSPASLITAANTIVPASAPAKALFRNVLEGPQVSTIYGNGPVQFVPARGTPFGWKLWDVGDYRPSQVPWEGGRGYTPNSTVQQVSGLGAAMLPDLTVTPSTPTKVLPTSVNPTAPAPSTGPNANSITKTDKFASEELARQAQAQKFLATANSLLAQMQVFNAEMKKRWADIQNMTSGATREAVVLNKVETAQRALPAFTELNTKTLDLYQQLLSAAGVARTNGADTTSVVTQAQAIADLSARIMQGVQDFAAQVEEARARWQAAGGADESGETPAAVEEGTYYLPATGEEGSSGIPLWAVAAGGVAMLGAVWFLTK